MPQRQRIAYMIFLIVVVVAPTAISLGWYQITKNPHLRPLAITQQALRDFGVPGHGVEILATIDWVPPPGARYSKAQLEKAVRDSFMAKGVDVHIRFRPGQSQTQVTYTIGRSVLGPFPVSQASKGIAAAVDAYRMN